MKIKVEKYYDVGRSGARIPNEKGWRLVATSQNFRLTHVIVCNQDAIYLDRGMDGYSASTVIQAEKFDYPPQPELPDEWRVAIRCLLEALELGLAAGIVKTRRDLPLEDVRFNIWVDHYAIITAQTSADGDPVRYAHRIVAEALAEINRLLHSRRVSIPARSVQPE